MIERWGDCVLVCSGVAMQQRACVAQSRQAVLFFSSDRARRCRGDCKPCALPLHFFFSLSLFGCQPSLSARPTLLAVEGVVCKALKAGKVPASAAQALQNDGLARVQKGHPRAHLGKGGGWSDGGWEELEAEKKEERERKRRPRDQTRRTRLRRIVKQPRLVCSFHPRWKRHSRKKERRGQR